MNLTNSSAYRHHRIVILVPQVIKQDNKKPKSHHPHHHHHGKVIPVVHSGKVIHAHHHHGKVDHLHGHDGKAKHEHKHQLTGGHKHSHFGVGTHKHKHEGKGEHVHKHDAKASHKHHHAGKGTIHHLHEKHHHQHHPKHPKQPPTKKFKNPFYGFEDGENEAYAEPRVRIDAELLRALNPANALLNAAAAAPYTNPNPSRIIQIRIPDENDANVVKEIDIDTQSDLAVLKKNYITLEDGARYTDGLELLGNQDETGDETEDTDGESEYQLGDGYRLAATAAARAATVADDNGVINFTADDAVDASAGLPSYRNNGGAYSDTFYYQY